MPADRLTRSLRPPVTAVTVLAVVAVLTGLVGLAACSSDATKDSATDLSTTGVGSSSTTAAFDPAKVPAAPSDGCTSKTPVSPGETKVTLPGTDARVDRWYLQHLPPAAASGTTPLPVVVDIHGYIEGAVVHTNMTQMGAYGDEQGFITIFPNGPGPIAHWDTRLGSADLEWFGTLFDNIESTLCVDTNRIFVSGLSNGAEMTSSVACTYSDRVASVAPVAGIQIPAGCTFTRPVPVLTIHGTEDPYFPIAGGLGPAAEALPSSYHEGTIGEHPGDPSLAEHKALPVVTADWAKRNGCTGAPKQDEVASDVTLFSYPCPADASVEFYRVDGGGHAWPGSRFSASAEATTGRTTFSIDANEIIGKFFETHPLSGTN